MERRGDIERIADYNGAYSQINQLGEECVELAQAVFKFHRYMHNWVNRMPMPQIMGGLIEEMADVRLMLMQVEYLLECKDDVAEMMNEKIDRMLWRIDGATEERRGASDRDNRRQRDNGEECSTGVSEVVRDEVCTAEPGV